ncbi:MAG: 2-iminoacetate synthase ThiH [Flavobacteriales bacterium]|nr:2-iminoacetate synthase ThiH [Flavobacteriales bacterium]MCB9448408.1 2-iminoacetate synthase ThiH [Flavobacteriales bacterium]
MNTSGFLSVFENLDWDRCRDRIYSMKASDVEAALHRAGKGSPDDFMALISPAAAPYLETMARTSRMLTQKRFGKTMQMYIPMYLSNECQNICTYCGFSFDNKLPRVTLNDEQILEEVKVIKSMGMDHVLLVTGEANRKVGVDYLAHAISLIRPYFSHISLEVQPLEQDEYERLGALGLHTVLVYQETYHRDAYKDYHPKGKKSNFEYRLDTPDRLGKAGIHKIGLGALIGLEEWRTDAFFTALHMYYLERTYWQSRFSISFPRLRPAEGIIEPRVSISEKDLTQLICAYRIFNENVELSLSTRERPTFRNHILGLGITTMSAGSRTNPGGYTEKEESLEQFEIDDDRSPAEMAKVIRDAGLEVVWKDWDRVLNAS